MIIVPIVTDVLALMLTSAPFGLYIFFRHEI